MTNKNIDINKNREELLREIQEIQADFQELSDEEIIDCREVILERTNKCLLLLNESDKDNIQ